MEEVQAHALAAARQFGGMWLASMREVIKVALAQAYKTAPPSLLAHLPPLAAATRSVELVLLVLLLASSAYMLVACVRGTSARPRDAAPPSTSAHRAPSPLPAATDKPRDAAAAAIAKLMRTRPSSVDGDVLFCTLCGQRVVEPCEDSVAKHVNGKRHKAAVDKYSTLATQAKPKLQPRHVLNWMSEDAFRSVYKARHGDEPSPTSPPAPAAAAVPAALPAATLRAATTVAGGAGAATSAKAADISVRHAPTEVQRSYFFELAHTNVLHDLASVRDAVTSKAEQQFMKALERDFMSFVDKRKHTYSPSVGSAAALLRFGCYYSVKDAQLQPKLAVHSMPPELKKLAQAVSRRVAEGLGKELPDLLACHAWLLEPGMHMPPHTFPESLPAPIVLMAVRAPTRWALGEASAPADSKPFTMLDAPARCAFVLGDEVSVSVSFAVPAVSHTTVILAFFGLPEEAADMCRAFGSIA